MTRILCLDDNPGVLKILSSVLQATGCEVLTTTDSYEAWALLQSVPVDLFAEDFMRSDIDGIEFLHHMKSDEKLRAVPVLGITAGPREVRTKQLREYGLDIDRDLNGFIQKPPFKAEDLLDTVGAIPEIKIMMPDRAKSRPPPKARAEQPDIDTSIKALKDRDPSVRLAAVNNLKWLQDTRAVEPLLSLLSDSEIQVRWAAIDTLGLLNDKRAAQRLIRLLSNADIINRWAAALALGRLAAKEALEALVAVLADENSLVRMTATLSLGHLKEPRVVTSLQERLTDSDPMVGRAARASLHLLEKEASFELVICKECGRKNASHRAVCHSCAAALGTPKQTAKPKITEKLKALPEKVFREIATATGSLIVVTIFLLVCSFLIWPLTWIIAYEWIPITLISFGLDCSVVRCDANA